MNIFVSKLINSKWLVLLFILLGSFICVCTKYEFFWDFANYHYYNAWALVHDRLNFDVVPGSINTFFNPLLDLPLYFLIEYFNDNLTIVYAFQGVWFGLLLFVFFKFASLFFDVSTIKGSCLAVVSMGIAATGQAVWFQAGSSTNEIQIALFAFCGLYILFKMIKFQHEQRWWKFLVSGLILGCALGFKPTIIYVCMASGISIIICYKYLYSPLKFILLFAIGGFLGYLIVNGWWMYKLWSLYDNPFFPFLNAVFKSEYFDDFNYSDRRFIPPLKYMLLFPYIWLDGRYKTAEISFVDWRGCIFYTIALFVLVRFLKKPKRIIDFYKNNRLWFIYAVFMILAYLFWMFMFSIYRYLVVIEMTAAIFFVKMCADVDVKSNFAKFIKWGMFIGVVILLFIIPDKAQRAWGTRINDTKMIEIEDLRLPDNTLLKLYNFPTSFVVPILAEKTTNIRAVGYSHLNAGYMRGSDFVERGKFKQIRDEIEKNHKGPIVIIYRNLKHTIITGRVLHKRLKSELENYSCRELRNSIEYINICVELELEELIF